MSRFAGCAIIVEWMRGGMDPQTAAARMVARMARFYPKFVGGMVAINRAGIVGAAAHNWTMASVVDWCMLSI